MKKAVLLLFACILFTACTSKNNYIDNLYHKRGNNISYIINVKSPNKNNEYIYFKSYIKGDKWKTILLYNGNTESIYTYNGGDKIYNYNMRTNKLKQSPVPEDLRHDNALNMVAPIVYWKKPVGMSELDSQPALVSTNETINKQKCSMIKFGKYREACISNETGLAVYHKFQNHIFYLNDAKLADIPDEIFETPKHN